MSEVYHLHLEREQLKGARIAFVPGDPDRVHEIAGRMDTSCVQLARKREYNTFLAHYEGVPVVVTSTGIGGPSTAIAVEELARLGIDTFIRIGTTGAIQDHIQVTDVIITQASVRLDGTSACYAPIAYPAVSDHFVTHALVEASKALGTRFHVGVTASTDSFYPGQERYDTFSGYVIKSLQGSLEEFKRLGVVNYEMESATLLTMCSTMGLRAGCVAGVIVNRTRSEHVELEQIKAAEYAAMDVAIRSLKYLP